MPGIPSVVEGLIRQEEASRRWKRGAKGGGKGDRASKLYETTKTFLSEDEKEAKRSFSAKQRAEYRDKVAHGQFVWRNNLIGQIETVMASVDHIVECRAELDWFVSKFPRSESGTVHRLIHRSRKVRGIPVVDVLLERTEKLARGPKKSIVGILTSGDRRSRLALTRLLGKEQGLRAKELFDNLRKLQGLWLTCAAFNPGGEVVKRRGVSVLQAWLEHVRQSLPLIADALASAGAEYEKLNAALLELIFEFNQYQQPVRYRSIILRHELKHIDEMGLPKPEFYIVVFLNRRTGQRRTIDLRRYKTGLRDRARGGAPSLRECTGLITGPILKHCYLGRKKGELLNIQQRLLDLLKQWEPLRATLLDCIKETRSI